MSGAGNRRGQRLAVLVAALVAVLVLAPAASAAPKRVSSFFGSVGAGDGQFSATTGVGGVAVNQNGVGGAAAGDVYVVDRGGHRIERFDASGVFKGAFGLNVAGAGVNTCTTGCVAGTSGTVGGAFATPQSVAVDQVDGSVYVLDGANLRLQKFTATGTFVWAVGKDVDSVAAGTGAEVCTTAANCKIGVTGALGSEFATTFTGQVAVDPVARTVYVTDPGNRRVQQLTAAGAFIRTFGFDVDSVNPSTGFEICTIASECKIAVAATTAAAAAQGQFPTNQPTRVAIDSAGAVYTVTQAVAFRVQKFTPFGVGLVPSFFAAATLNGTAAASTPTDVAIDPATQNVLVAKAFAAGATSPCPSGANSVVERRILELTSSGGSADTHMACAGINVVNGLAVRRSDAPDHAGGIYASSTTDGQRVYVLDTTGATAPTATVSAATAIDTHTATLNGEVNRNDPASAFSVAWHFEYSKNGIDWTSAPAANSIISGVTSDPVSLTPQNIAGIEANQTYKVRIVATKQYNAANVTSPEGTFTTTAVGPENVVTQPAFPIRTTTATLNGTVNANNQPTTVHFDYTTDTDFQANAWDNAEQTPDVQVTGGTVRAVTAQLTDLEPATAYRYRIVAASTLGDATGTSQRFFTAANLPTDARGVPVSPTGRKYEMVTPPVKATRRGGGGSSGDGVDNGVDAYSANPATPSPDGNSVLLSLPYGVLDNPGGSASSDPNRQLRTEEGWQTQPIFKQSFVGNLDATSARMLATSRDQTLNVWDILGNGSIFAEQSGFSRTFTMRLMGRDPDWATPPGWTRVPGWAPLITAQSQYGGTPNNASLFTDSGRYLVSSAYVRGLMGPDDPSLGQRPSAAGGGTAYRLDLDDGTRELVNECAGTGPDATLIPNRANASGTGNGTGVTTDTIGSQPCSTGSLISTRGAAVGAGNNTSGPGVLGGSIDRAASNTASNDGDRVFFTSPDPTLGTSSTNPSICAAGTAVGVNTDCPSQLYARRWDADGNAKVAWISRSRANAVGGGAYGGSMIAGQQIAEIGRGAGYEGASKDGSKVFFRTNAPLVSTDPNGGNSITAAAASGNSWDLYRYDLPSDPNADPGSGTLTRITGGPDETADPNVACSTLSGANCTAWAGSAVRASSEDGSRVYFVTAGVIPGAINTAPGGSGPANVAGGAAANVTTRNLYLYDANKAGAARWQFVARIPYSAEGLDACTSRNFGAGPPMFTNPTTGLLSAGEANCVRTTSDGRYLVFTTAATLTPDDTDSAHDVYAYDADAGASGTLTRVSAPDPDAGGSPYPCVTTGNVQCNADLGWRKEFGLVANGPSGNSYLNLADDGSVFFESRVPLVADDVNGSRMDTYQWKDGHLSLVSPGNTDDDAYFSGNSASGRDVFIATTQAIDPREVEAGDADIYDARIDGGFAPPPPPPVVCAVLADGCQGSGAADTQVVGDTSRVDGRPGGDNSPRIVRGEVSLKKLSSSQLKKLIAGRATDVSIRVNQAGKVSVAGDAKLGRKVRRVLSSSRNAAGEGMLGVPVKLSAAARKELAKTGKLKVTLSVRFSKARKPVTSTLNLKVSKTKSNKRTVKSTKGGVR